jgi:hypothetical protein
MTMVRRRCVVCGKAAQAPIFLVESRGIPHGQPGHDVVYDYKLLFECARCLSGQLEVYSHDCWSHEDPWEMYWWYAFPPVAIDSVKHLGQVCSSPVTSSCECSFHQFVRHELRRVHSGIPYARSAEDAKQYCWLRMGLDKHTNSPCITVDKSKAVGEVE